MTAIPKVLLTWQCWLICRNWCCIILCGVRFYWLHLCRRISGTPLADTDTACSRRHLTRLDWKMYFSKVCRIYLLAVNLKSSPIRREVAHMQQQQPRRQLTRLKPIDRACSGSQQPARDGSLQGMYLLFFVLSDICYRAIKSNCNKWFFSGKPRN